MGQNLLTNKATQSPEPSDLNRLFLEYREQVYGFAYKNIKSDSLAQDIVQEVFLVLCEKDLNTIQNIRSYIFQITQNKVVDHIRRRAKNKVFREEMWSVIQKKQQAADHIIIEKEYLEHLRQAKSLLTPQQRLIFELSREKNLSHVEIADKLGLSRHTVKNHISAALKILREYLLVHSDAVISILLFAFCF